MARTLKKVLEAVADNAHDRAFVGIGAQKQADERHAKLLAEAEAARYPVIVDGMYGVVLVPADVFERVETATPLAEGGRYLCANAKQVEHLKALGVDVPDELTFDWFKVLSASV